MLIAEYSYEKDIEVKQQEARQEGRQEGLLLSAQIFQAVKRTPDSSDEQIAQDVGCTIEEVQNTRKMFGI